MVPPFGYPVVALPMNHLWPISWIYAPHNLSDQSRIAQEARQNGAWRNELNHSFSLPAFRRLNRERTSLVNSNMP